MYVRWSEKPKQLSVLLTTVFNSESEVSVQRNGDYNCSKNQSCSLNYRKTQVKKINLYHSEDLLWWFCRTLCISHTLQLTVVLQFRDFIFLLMSPTIDFPPPPPLWFLLIAVATNHGTRHNLLEELSFVWVGLSLHPDGKDREEIGWVRQTETKKERHTDIHREKGEKWGRERDREERRERETERCWEVERD